jgi:predicted porin
MKKTTLLANSLGLAFVCTPVLAQSVELYGIVDAGVNRISGLAGGAKNFALSGIMEGSRLGFRGNEDLGSGYRAVFTLENRFEADTGATSVRPLSGAALPDRLTNPKLLGMTPQAFGAPPGVTALPPSVLGAVAQISANFGSKAGINVENRFFDRQAFVGLVTPYGGLILGRQYTPAYEMLSVFDTLATQSSLSMGQVAALPTAIDIRSSNAAQYRIKFGGFSAAAMAAAGENSQDTGRLLAGNAIYKTDFFSLGLGYNARKNEANLSSLSTLVVGGTVKAGPGTVFASYATAKDKNPSGLSSFTGPLAPFKRFYVEALKQDGRLIHLGYKWNMGAHTVYVAGTRYDDRRPNDADVTSYGTAYSYAFSKRTDANLVITRFNNKNLAQAAPGQAGFIGGVTSAPGVDSNSVALGLRHRF